MLRRSFLSLLSLSILSGLAFADDKPGEWKELFDGKTFEGWKINENKESWSIEDGKIVSFGERSHLFYVAEDKPFKNFEFECECMTTPGSNAGIYFHTKPQDT